MPNYMQRYHWSNTAPLVDEIKGPKMLHFFASQKTRLSGTVLSMSSNIRKDLFLPLTATKAAPTIAAVLVLTKN